MKTIQRCNLNTAELDQMNAGDVLRIPCETFSDREKARATVGMYRMRHPDDMIRRGIEIKTRKVEGDVLVICDERTDAE